jgi:hypothetical protein
MDGSGRTVSEPMTLNLIPELCTMTGPPSPSFTPHIPPLNPPFSIPGLSDEMRENFSLMKDMGQHTRVDPESRARNLSTLMEKIRKNKDAMKALEQSGLEFEDNLLMLRGRQLNSETILTYTGKFSYQLGEPDWTRHVRSARLVSTQDMEVSDLFVLFDLGV